MGARVPYRELTADQGPHFLDHGYVLAQEKQRLGRLP